MSAGLRWISICLALIATTTLSVAGPAPALAAWPPFGQAVCTASKGQTHVSITTDGAGGAILAWQDQRDAKVNIFAQHVLASGDVDLGWALNGQRMIVDASLGGAAGGNFGPLIVSDGAGGAVVAWVDLREVTSDKLDLFAQHILASGVLDASWPTNGRQLVSAPGVGENFAMVSDGAGGAIVTWTDGRTSPDFDLFAQHVLGTGALAPGWPTNGLAVCTASGRQQFPAIVTDGSGGAIISWDDLRSSISGDDVYALRVLGSGAIALGWPVNGRVVCAAAGDQGHPTLTPDGASGVIVAWTDSRVVGSAHIFAQHVLGSGVVDPAWTVDGVAISNAGPLETRPLAVGDGAGGAVIAWQAFTVHLNMYAQHVLATGTVDPRWSDGGRALSITDRTQSHADIATDDLGGAIVAWEDSGNVVAQHVGDSGLIDTAYPDTGRQIVDLPSDQGDVAIVSTPGGGAIVAWTDTRNGKDTDIYAMQVLEAATVDVSETPPENVTFARPSPNPARASLALRFSLPRDAHVRLAIYDVTGRLVREVASGTRAAGQHTIAWDLRDADGLGVRGGLYFARLTVEGHSLTHKVIALE